MSPICNNFYGSL